LDLQTVASKADAAADAAAVRILVPRHNIIVVENRSRRPLAKLKIIVWPESPGKDAVAPFEDLGGCQAIELLSAGKYYGASQYAVAWTDVVGGRWIRQVNGVTNDRSFRPDEGLPDVTPTKLPTQETIREMSRYALSDGCGG
jgi:hypothetical protein